MCLCLCVRVCEKDRKSVRETDREEESDTC